MSSLTVRQVNRLQPRNLPKNILQYDWDDINYIMELKKEKNLDVNIKKFKKYI